jgi:hypothetical protein
MTELVKHAQHADPDRHVSHQLGRPGVDLRVWLLVQAALVFDGVG